MPWGMRVVTFLCTKNRWVKSRGLSCTVLDTVQCPLGQTVRRTQVDKRAVKALLEGEGWVTAIGGADEV